MFIPRNECNVPLCHASALVLDVVNQPESQAADIPDDCYSHLDQSIDILSIMRTMQRELASRRSGGTTGCMRGFIDEAADLERRSLPNSKREVEGRSRVLMNAM